MAIKPNIPEMSTLSPFKEVVSGEAFANKGVMVMKKADGKAYKAVKEVTGGVVIGINFDAVTAADQYMQIREGIFQFTNSGTAPVTNAHLNNYCDVVDEKTVAAPGTSTWTNPVKAGRVVNVSRDGGYVFVEVGKAAGFTAASS